MSSERPPPPPSRGHPRLTLACLVFLYVVWGTSYLAIHYAMDSFPPFSMAATRCLVSGALLYVFALLRKQPAPTRRQWLGAGLVGSLILAVPNAGIVYAEQWVTSSLTAVIMASVGLWAACLSLLFGYRPSLREWLGVSVGLLGVMMVHWAGNLKAHPVGCWVLLGACAAWALGTLLASRCPLPSGAMSAACQSLAGGALLAALALSFGESWPHHISLQSGLALVYLILFPSVLGYSAYTYLISPAQAGSRTPRVSTSTATSFAYVNPIVATLVGVLIGGEHLSRHGSLGLIPILIAIHLVTTRRG